MKKMSFPLRVAAAAVLAASLAAEGAVAPQEVEPTPLASVDEAVMEVAEPAPIGVPEPKPETPMADFAIIGPNGERTIIPMDQLEVREATGSLEGIDGQEITLAVGGRRYVCPLLAKCVFVDEKGQQVDRAAFVQRFLRRYVTVELEKTTGTVLSCRAM
ncbi:hypothetical protein [uncultured Fretibacterium sp.]|uniref:hypothetical protein n=1 Tax=uncultured Fretibacterium sp. TaxID=1678694 RepID=UPI002617784D|nr:hypothetical protein [uncultured Fretibacterium sp.]